MRSIERKITLKVPALVRLMQAWPFLQRIPARVIGMGFRPERARVPAHPGAAARGTEVQPAS